jgi:hypothetical protein
LEALHFWSFVLRATAALYATPVAFQEHRTTPRAFGLLVATLSLLLCQHSLYVYFGLLPHQKRREEHDMWEAAAHGALIDRASDCPNGHPPRPGHIGEQIEFKP